MGACMCVCGLGLAISIGVSAWPCGVVCLCEAFAVRITLERRVQATRPPFPGGYDIRGTSSCLPLASLGKQPEPGFAARSERDGPSSAAASSCPPSDCWVAAGGRARCALAARPARRYGAAAARAADPPIRGHPGISPARKRNDAARRARRVLQRASARPPARPSAVCWPGCAPFLAGPLEFSSPVCGRWRVCAFACSSHHCASV